MEIIPILSTIILVATIATFILAVAAYILYKIRERRARSGGARPMEAVAATPTHTLVAPSQMLALPQAYGPGVSYGGQPGYGQQMLNAPPPYPGLDTGYGAQGLPPMAIDTNADGRPDTVYEPRPTAHDAYGAPTAYQPSADALPPYGMTREIEAQRYTPPMPAAAPYGAPAYGTQPYSAQPYGTPTPMAPVAPVYAAPQAPVAALPPAPTSGGLFYEITGQGLTPVAPAMPATPGLPVYPPALPPAVPPAYAAEQALATERARLQTIEQAQDRLADAEDASRARADALRQQRRDGDGPGLAWY